MPHTSSGMTFRTTGSWGTGKGSNLTPVEVDENFNEAEQRLEALEDNPPVAVSIASINVVGSSMTIFLDDSTELGPFTLPTAAFNWTGDWSEGRAYFELDVFREPGEGVFLVTADFESASNFDPNGQGIALMIPDRADWLTGAGSPAESLGNEGDLYLDTDNGEVFQHVGSPGWELVADITGPAGPAAATLDDIGDVDYGSPDPSEGAVLVRRGADWAPEPGVGRQTAWIQAAGMQPTVTDGAGDDISQAGLATVELTAGRPNITYLPFDATTKQNAQWSISMPKAWDLGTFIFKVAYSHAGGQDSGLDGVAWGLSAVAVSDGETVDVVFGTEVIVTKDASGADIEHITAESAPMTAAGSIAAGDTVYFNLARVVVDGADDLNVDARLHGVTLIYLTTALTDD